MADDHIASWQDVYDLIIVLCEHSDEFRKRGASALRFLNAMERGPVPRPYCDWHEDRGDVLWWRMPISEPPYAGTPLDLGRTIEWQVGDNLSVKVAEVGGWPFDETDESHLWWTPLPDAKRIQDQVPL